MLKLLYMIFIIVVFLIALIFTYMNDDIVELNYFSIKREVHLSLLLLCTLIAGVVCGYLAGLPASVKNRRAMSVLKKELDALKSRSL